ncbi:hypothetical protein AGMMS50249_4090 [candidate division SR1 bacterium]|nr:hypothetical protein AGMMS50249_4090 [candidate division SR1 bacterium]
MKAIEESGLQSQIDAVYGVSVGAIIASYRASGWTADQIFEQFSNLSTSALKWISKKPTKSLLSTSILQSYFTKDLPQTFAELKKPVFIGASDINTAKLILFHQGPLLKPVLGSIALPGIFESVKYLEYLLNDGGITNNFPVAEAKTRYPHHKIIGIDLNKFQFNTNPKNLVSTLITSYDIVMNKDGISKSRQIDISFYEDIHCGLLDIDKKKRKQAFDQGYKSGHKAFQQTKKSD